MNKIIKISVVVTLALIIALFAGCGKKKPKKENESSIRTDGFLNEIFGDDFDDGESTDKNYEDEVDAGALDALESGNATTNNSSEATSSKNNTSSSSSKNESSSKNQTSSKNETSSSKNESTTSSKNEVTSSKNQSSSSKNEGSSNTSTTSSKNTVSTDNDSTIYTPGWS